MSHLPHIRKKTTARFSRSCRKTFRIIISSLFGPKFILILLLIEEKILLRGIVGPNIFNGLVNIALVFDFLQILKHFERSPRTCSIIDQLIFRRRPWSVFEFGCQFKCPVKFISSIFPVVSRLGNHRAGPDCTRLDKNVPYFACQHRLRVSCLNTDLQKYKKNDTNQENSMKHHASVTASSHQGIHSVSSTAKYSVKVRPSR